MPYAKPNWPIGLLSYCMIPRNRSAILAQIKVWADWTFIATRLRGLLKTHLLYTIHFNCEFLIDPSSELRRRPMRQFRCSTELFENSRVFELRQSLSFELRPHRRFSRRNSHVVAVSLSRPCGSWTGHHRTNEATNFIIESSVFCKHPKTFHPSLSSLFSCTRQNGCTTRAELGGRLRASFDSPWSLTGRTCDTSEGSSWKAFAHSANFTNILPQSRSWEHGSISAAASGEPHHGVISYLQHRDEGELRESFRPDSHHPTLIEANRLACRNNGRVWEHRQGREQHLLPSGYHCLTPISPKSLHSRLSTKRKHT